MNITNYKCAVEWFRRTVSEKCSNQWNIAVNSFHSHRTPLHSRTYPRNVCVCMRLLCGRARLIWFLALWMLILFSFNSKQRDREKKGNRHIYCIAQRHSSHSIIHYNSFLFAQLFFSIRGAQQQHTHFITAKSYSYTIVIHSADRSSSNRHEWPSSSQTAFQITLVRHIEQFS